MRGTEAPGQNYTNFHLKQGVVFYSRAKGIRVHAAVTDLEFITWPSRARVPYTLEVWWLVFCSTV